MDNKKNIAKLRKLKITNFKAIDELEIDFPEPDIDGDPDITVIGSKNGVGKTSVLEACSLLRVFAGIGESINGRSNILSGFAEKFIRADAEYCEIKGTFQINEISKDVLLNIRQDGSVNLTDDLREYNANSLSLPIFSEKDLRNLLLSNIGLNFNPFIASGFLYFHSYRKTDEGNIELKTLTKNKDKNDKLITPSTFKLEVIKAIMANANLLEGVDSKNSKEVLDKLNWLSKEYAGVKIEKLRSVNNAYELRVSSPKCEKPYSFDGLSSGQKEMISTLFIIWRYYNETPGIVLIDEPELHLNSEWHRTFINGIVKLAPDNQYIIATHSETIAASVDKEQRVIIGE